MKLLSLLLIATLSFGLEYGKIPKKIILDGDKGSTVSGQPWSSSMLRGNIYILFYVDPDKKDLNEPLSEALQKYKFPSAGFGSVAVINMGATWLPNFAISSSLEKKQEKYPRTLYVKDLEKTLVKEWDLQDDNSDIVLFDKDGTVLFVKNGELNEEEIQEVINLIKEKGGFDNEEKKSI